jgi:LPXTG-site transpeptidase (sortase) family protein
VLRRRFGLALLTLGGLVLAWVFVTVRFGDPVTSLYTRYEQRQLSHQLDRLNQQWASPEPAVRLVGLGGPAQRVSYPKPKAADAATSSQKQSQKQSRATQTLKPKQTPSAKKRQLAKKRLLAKNRAQAKKAALVRVKKTLARRATAFGRHLTEEQAIGRIVIPKLHLRMVVVEGTSEGSLRKGPGHYNALSGEKTDLPGQGGTVAIAGHRTTYLRPFRYIDTLEPGDKIWIVMPYGQFAYTVYGHRIVTPTDWSILRPRPYEKLVLSACNPLYSAAQRWVVFARLTGMSTATA